MISSRQFDEALKLLSDYKVQLETGVFEIPLKGKVIDIQNKLSRNTFYSLKNYYKDLLDKKLEWNDLKEMDLETLKKIDFMMLRRYRGFGRVAEENLKKTINSYSNNSDNL